MTIGVGTRLGPYEVLQIIGSGGMGEVYRARDGRLNRDVAVKVLPAAFIDDPDRRERFQREAQAIAAMSHPNILAIYDVDLSGASAFVVTELLEGETLRTRLSGGALAVRKTIDYAVQIARGLSAAHERGLVHRDLKPENIFVCQDGRVKILDFGLAKTSATPGSGGTLTAAVLTDPGTVLGTAGYMAPEQVRGLTTDARADIFAFGAVLYEMLTGRRAFSGATAADTMTAILKEEPVDLTASRADVSPALDRIVRHCLEKDPQERFQSARDVAFALEALSGSGTMRTAALAEPIRARRPIRWALGALAVLAAIGAGAGIHAVLTSSTPSLVQYDVKTFDRLWVMNARFMPDGKTIVFSACRRDTTPELFIKRPDSIAPDTLGAPGTHLLSVSSKGELAVLTDSTHIAHRLFRGTLARMTPGGAPRPWLENVREADWSPDGASLAVIRDAADAGDRLEYPAGTVLYQVNGYLSDVRVSHDGRLVAFVEHRFRFDDRGLIKVIRTDRSVAAASDEYWGVEGVAWSPDDTHVLFSASDWNASGGIGYHPFALSLSGNKAAVPALATMGDALINDVNADRQWLIARETYATTMIVKRPDEPAERDISWLDLPVPTSMSADGTLITFTDENVNAGHSYAVMIRKTDGSPPVRLGEGNSRFFGLSPDRRWVVAELMTGNQLVMYPTGAGEPRRLNTDAAKFRFAGWFPDSQHLLWCDRAAGPERRCYRQSMDGGAMTPIGTVPGSSGSVAPDGTVVIGSSEDTAWRFPPGGGAPVRLDPGPKDAAFVGWSTESQPFFSQQTASGDRDILYAPFGRPPQRLATISVNDRAGLAELRVAQVVGNARTFGYFYSYTRILSTLVVGSGIKVP